MSTGRHGTLNKARGKRRGVPVTGLVLKIRERMRQVAIQLKIDFLPAVGRNPKRFKKLVLTALALELPPYPKRAGAPRREEVTKAVHMFREQKGEGHVNWLPIYQACIPRYSKILNNDSRRSQEKKLRNAVSARLKGAKPHRRAKPRKTRRLGAPGSIRNDAAMLQHPPKNTQKHTN